MIIFVSSSDFRQKIVSRIRKISLKTVLDTFFVPFYYTKNTRTDVFNNYTQRVFLIVSNIKFVKHQKAHYCGIMLNQRQAENRNLLISCPQGAFAYKRHS